MASESYENSSQKIRSKAQKDRRQSAASKGAAKGEVQAAANKRDRAYKRESVRYTTVSKAPPRLREGSGARHSNSIRKTGLGLAPREAIQQWLQFAQANHYHRVAGIRQFRTDLEKVDTLIEEERSLFELCRAKGVSSFERLVKLARGLKSHEGAEHRVFYSLDDDPPRATKITFPGKYGRIEHTPFLYLERLALFNELFPALDIRFEDCISNGNGVYMIVSSMRAFSGAHPTLNEVDAFLRDIGFVIYSDGSITIDYRNPELGIIVRDCHPRNWVKTRNGSLVPIDISPEIG